MLIFGLDSSKLKVKAICGDTNLGGEDFLQKYSYNSTTEI